MSTCKSTYVDKHSADRYAWVNTLLLTGPASQPAYANVLHGLYSIFSLSIMLLLPHFLLFPFPILTNYPPVDRAKLEYNSEGFCYSPLPSLDMNIFPLVQSLTVQAHHQVFNKRGISATAFSRRWILLISLRAAWIQRGYKQN